MAILAVVFAGQMTLNPIIAPLSREVGLADWQVGVTISTAAVMVVTTSQLWGRRAQASGFKPVLLLALTAAVVTMVLFSLVAAAGMQGTLTSWPLFLGFLLLRGVAFGAAIAAVMPTVQTYVAQATSDAAARVRGMAAIGAVQASAAILGSVIGGGLATFGLLTSIVAVPVLISGALALTALRFRAVRTSDQVAEPARVKLTDARIWPFLLTGFGLFSAMGFMQIIMGFLLQDRLDVSAEQAGQLTGGSLLVMGLGMILAQAGVVSRAGWLPPKLLRVGSMVAVVGFAALLPDLGAWLMFVGVGVAGLGLGIALPGYAAGPTMLVTAQEQGGVAGVTGAVNGLTYVLAPTLSTLLYQWWQPLPILISVVALLLVLGFVYAHPAFRNFHPVGQL